MNFIEDTIEEIALEGLDGITINSLWVRLQSRPKFCMKLDEKSKEFLWQSVAGDDRLEFYVMPEEREDLLPYDRFAFKDPITGIWVHNVGEQNIYPLNVVEDEGVQGSCSFYKTRKLVTGEVRNERGDINLNLSHIQERWGRKFVVVANQKTRWRALVKERDPRIELTNMMYCVLERVGRMRYSGETSYALSKQFYNNIQSQIYYLCKKLHEVGFITKQQFLTQVENNKNLNVRLIHLKHFYVPVKNKYAQLMEKVSLYLESKPDHTEVYNTFKTHMSFMRKSFKNLLSTYSKYLKTGVRNYTAVIPDASPKDYLCKTDNNKEKQIRVITLVQPFRAATEDCDDVDSSDSEDEDVTPYEWKWGKTTLDQCLKGLESGGAKGLSHSQFSAKMGLTRLEARSVLRKITRLGLCQTYKMDAGRQRKNIFVASSLFQNSEVLQEYEAEKSALEKNLNLTFDGNVSANTSSLTLNESASESTLDDTINTEDEKITAVQKRQLEWLSNPYKKAASSRLLRRTNWIYEAVHESRVIENEFHLLKLIWQKEQAQGLQEKMDKRSLKRILHWLKLAGKIQLLKTVLQKEGQSVDLTIVCLPEITPNDPAVKLAIEQAKLRLIGVRKENMEVQKMEQTGEQTPDSMKSCPKPNTIHAIPSVTESIQRFQEYRNRIKTNTPMKYDVQSWRRYGLVPKFKRYQLVHEMLYYLLYSYQGQLPSSVEHSASQHSIDFTWTLDTPANNEPLDEGAIDEMLAGMKEPPVYHDDLSWKRYLAPLPHHAGITENSEGWSLISDILILLPLTVVCQIVNIPYRIDGLEKLLSDPKKRLYPITYLPYWITNQLLYARRYVYAFYECCSHLAKMGLLSFGPQIRNAKEKAFIYLHPRAVLRDTRTSLPGYMKTVLPEDLTEFPLKKYVFNSMSDVELYWCDMLMIVLDTNLNCKGLVQKEDNLTDDVELSLEESVTIKSFKDLPQEPMLPGDHRGAGGFDSSLFCHLMRNWFRISDMKKVSTEGSTVGVQPSINNLAEKMLQRKTTHRKDPPVPPPPTKTVSTKVGPSKGNRGGKGIKRNLRRKRQEKVKAPPKKKVRKTYYDDIDFKALGMMTRERVIWTSREDGVLLLCKVASCLMGGIRRGLMVAWTVVRDILHEKCKETSVDKSSKACQRRVAFAFKNPVSKMNVSLYLSQAKQDKELMEKYGNKKYAPAEIIPTFKELVSVLLEKFKTHEDEDDCNDFPKSQEDFKANFKLSNLDNIDYWKTPHIDDIKSSTDVYFNVLYDLIHSYVVAQKDKQGRSHEMYRIFNQYPDVLLTEVFSRMKDDGIITKIKKTTKPLLYGINHHQLAQRYKRRFLTRFPDNLFNECHEFLERLWQKYVESDGDDGVNIKSVEAGGLCASLLSLNCLRKLRIRVKIPSEILVLDRSGCNLPISRGRIQKKLDDLQSDDDDDDDDDDEDDLLGLNKDGDRNKTRKKKKSKNLLSKEREENLMQHIIDISQAADNEVHNEERLAEVRGEGQRSMDTNDTIPEHEKATDNPEKSSENPENEAAESSRNTSHTSDTSPDQIEVLLEAPKHVSSPTKQDVCQMKSLSRALLALARNESFQKVSSLNYNVQDNILINSCDVQAFLMPTMRRHSPHESQIANSGGNSEISSLFLSPEKFKEIIHKQQMLVPFHLDLDNVWTSVRESHGEGFAQDVQHVHKFVASYGIMGVKHFELLKKLSHISDLKLKVESLCDHFAILRVGVNCCRYVAFSHARPWLIHSYKNMRGRGASKQNPGLQDNDEVLLSPDEQSDAISLKSNQANISGHHDTSQISDSVDENVRKQTQDKLPTSSATPSTSSSSATTSTSSTTSGSKKRAAEEPVEEVRRSKRRKIDQADTKEAPLGDYEKVRLICRPWRKPEGHLNRSTFSSMLETILLFVMSNPACLRKAIEDRFSPYLKPMAVLELLEILEQLGCVSKIIYRKTSSKTSLFSKPSTYVKVDEEDEGDMVMYESTRDCCLKFGQFAFFLSALN